MIEKSKNSCDCECKKGVERYTPVAIYNPAGLSAFTYRVGNHGRFKAQMLADISSSSKKALSDLTTRTDRDLSIALLDSWATIADVLSFYQERIANEGFLRTATERKSVMELARSISYELRPGVAASTSLAFAVEDSPTSPQRVLVEAGTKVQSIPGQNELPQIFETINEKVVRLEWSMAPQKEEEQDIFKQLKKGLIYFEGLATKLKPGDGVLFVAIVKREPIIRKPILFRVVEQVITDAKSNRTTVQVKPIEFKEETIAMITNDSVLQSGKAVATTTISSKDDGQKVIAGSGINFTEADLDKIIRGSPWSEENLESEAKSEGWPLDVIIDAINSKAKEKKDETVEVYAFRIKCSIFGSSAPLWKSLPPEQRFRRRIEKVNEDGTAANHEKIEPVYPFDWDVPFDANKDPTKDPAFNVNTDYTGKQRYEPIDQAIFLDNTYPILKDSWVVLHDPGSPPKTPPTQHPEAISAFKVASVSDRSMAGFSITSKITGLVLPTEWKDISSVESKKEEAASNLKKFYFRTTSVYALPEKIPLSKVPVESTTIPLSGNGMNKKRRIVLDCVVGWLKTGQRVVVSGELDGSPGINRDEIAVIERITHDFDNYFTTLELANNLVHTYKLDTVKINANLIEATHGETKEESIGNGDPSQPFTQFDLKNSPLTYISASTPTGISSTLQIRINGVKWEARSSFEESSHIDKGYVVRINDLGKTTVIFGDGVSGRRPPVGLENIRARYRVGIGTVGNLDANKLTILPKRPLGIKSVTNPLKADGGSDPESLDDARRNAPRTVLTMDRIVSVSDFQNFAQGFAGIGKATSYIISIGGSDTVLIAIASSTGDKVNDFSEVYINLVTAIESHKDPSTRFIVRSFKPRQFRVKAKILVSEDREIKDIMKIVKARLQDAFSFKMREFGQEVTLSEVVSIIQKAEGVEAVKIDVFERVDINYLENISRLSLFRVDMSKTGNQVEATIPAEPEHDENGIPVPTLLLIDPNGIELEEMSRI